MSRKSSGMPQISAAFSGWTSRLTLIKETETVTNGIVSKQQLPISFYGTIQTLSPRAIVLKPEGQRSWTWLQIHCSANATTLIPNDRIIWNGDKYKVMEMKDYRLNNYVEYHIIRDYQTGGTP
jgi:hypothetical protein